LNSGESDLPSLVAQASPVAQASRLCGKPESTACSSAPAHLLVDSIDLPLAPVGAAAISLSGVRTVLLPSRAVLLPDLNLALVADLHLGKAESLRALGAPFARDAMARMLDEQFARLALVVDTLTSLRQASCEAAAPPRLLILGDLLHAPIGLTPPLIDDVAGRFNALRRSRQLGTLLIRGNHDSKVDRVIAPWGLSDLGHEWTQHHAGTVIRFVHEPEAVDERAAGNPQAAAVGAPAAPRSNPSAQSQPHREDAAPAPLTFAGHIHPAIRLRAAPGQGNSESLKLPCFLIRRSPPTCILPAFTNFASGASITQTQSDQIYILIEDKVIKI
jgi:uncharacterized protein